MPDDPPSPPVDLPDDVLDALDALDDCSPAVLRQLAEYVERLAEDRERVTRAAVEGETAPSEESGDDRRNAVDEELGDPPNGVPSKATITVKEINDNRYYYWQWRDGDTVRSQYEGPVEPDR